MNIEEAIKYIKNDIEIDKDTASWFENGNMTKEQIEESIDAYETLLTAYEKEKEENKEHKERITFLENKIYNQKQIIKYGVKTVRLNVDNLCKNFDLISKDKIKEILGIEETDSEKILSLLQTIVDENARLEDIEDRKVQVDYERVFNKGVKSVENKIKAKVIEVKDRPVKDEFITASQGKLNTIIDIESLLD